MSNINSKNSSDAIIESKLFKLSLVDLEKNGGIKIGSFSDRLYSERLDLQSQWGYLRRGLEDWPNYL